jgi:hypothetical protein
VCSGPVFSRISWVIPTVIAIRPPCIVVFVRGF